MSVSGFARWAAAGALVVAGALVAPPAGAETDAPATGWSLREDARQPSSDFAYSWDDPYMSSSAGYVYTYANRGAPHWAFASFIAPKGKSLQAGTTYAVDASNGPSVDTKARLQVFRDGLLCGRTEEEIPGYGTYATIPATGWFHVAEIEYDGNGDVSRFAATYELNCQYLDGPVGLEGSVAVNASSPMAAVPAAPPTPGKVTGLKARNFGPDFSNKTTLTWANPAGFNRVSIDIIQSKNPAKFQSLVAPPFEMAHQVTGSTYVEEPIDGIETRTYRVTSRGPTGRLGTPTLLVVMGTRMTVREPDKLMIGETAEFRGRITESWDYVKPEDVMKGPPMAGVPVVLCQQSKVNFVYGECNVVDRTTTAADGSFNLSAKPTKNSLYNIVVLESPTRLGNATRVMDALVAPLTDLRARGATNARTSIESSRRGKSVHFSTARARKGSKGIVRLQRFDGDRWRTVLTRKLGKGSKRLKFTYREKDGGLHKYRVVKPGDSRHITGYSRTVRVRS